MIRLRTIRDLRKQPPASDTVYVASVNKLFRCHDGEWIEHAYYTTSEVANILGMSYRSVTHMITKLNLRPTTRGAGRNLNQDQILLLAKVKQMRSDNRNLKYAEIKKQLGI